MLLFLPLLCALAGCGGDDPAQPDPNDQAFPVELRFINDDADEVIIAGIRGKVEVPGETTPRQLLHNWQRPARGDTLVLIADETIPTGSVIEAWYMVCASWSTGAESTWRVWAADPDTAHTAADARQVFRWPSDRFNLTEIPFPPPTRR